MKRIHIIFILLLQICVIMPAAAQNKKDKDHKAKMAFNAGEYYKAVDLYKTAYNKIKDKNKQNEVIFKIAECYRIVRDNRKAELWYKKAISKNYQDPLVYLRYGEMLMMSENYQDAVVQFKRYKELVPDDPRGENGIRSCQVAVEWIENPTGYEVEEMRYFNSKERDFSPTFGEEDFNTVYFTSTREDATGKETSGASGESFSDIFVSNMDIKGKWSTPVPLSDEFNSEADDGTPSVSADFSTMYFTRCPRGKKEQLGCFIYYSHRSGGEWAKPDKIKIAEDSVVVAHPAISPDNLTLYFVSNLPGGYGGKDIWKITRENEGAEWSQPVNLGEDINTPGDEMFPYVHPDGTLYFSSDSHIGIGGLDIYKATMGENGRYTVDNMRPPINSSQDDFGITFEKDVERGFLSSSRKGRGNDEIYSFYLPPLKFNLTGFVRNEKNNEPLGETSIKSIGSDGITAEATTNEEGGFRFMLKPNTDYVFIASRKGFLNGKERETTKGLEKSKDFRTVIYLSPVDQVIELPNIYYDFGKWDLRPESMVALDKLVETLNDNPNITIELMSHTDSRGSAQDNQVLSQKRAQSVVDYLISKNIAPDRLQAKGYGESVPKVVDEKIAGENKFLTVGQVLSEEFINSLPQTNNEQETAHQINRRTEFRVLSTDYVPKK
ncbi:MAG: OmpA family protein [Bacteroidales bacterium]|nr:OmpA family protein [Bacteroidales bacterium]MCB8999908.1 OmpA family protein [Bacteroidales bacterium]